MFLQTSEHASYHYIKLTLCQFCSQSKVTLWCFYDQVVK